MENRLDVVACKENGWHVAVESGAWKIGYLNYSDGFDKKKLNSYERHHETDEVFVLLSGEATLFIGDGDKAFGNVSVHKMEYGKLYIIRRMAWHTQFMNEDCSILVIENVDTGLKNSDVVEFGAEFREELYKHI